MATDRQRPGADTGADDVEMEGPNLEDIPVSRLRRKFGWEAGDVEVRDPAGKVVHRPGAGRESQDDRKSAPFLSIGLIGWPAGPKSDDRSPVDS